MKLLHFVLFVTTLAVSQERVAAPHAGTVLGTDGLLRFIRGVPGAAYSEPSPNGESFLVAQSASHAAVGVAVTPKSVHLISESRSTALPIAAASAVAVSPQGKYIAVLTGDTLRIYETASGGLRTSFPLTSLGLTDPDSVNLAVSDDGSAVAVGAGTTAYADTTGRATFAPLALVHPRFSPASSAAVVAYSPADSALVLVHLPALTSEILASDRDGLLALTGIEFSRDPRTLWLSTGAASAFSYSFETRLLTTHTLPAGHLRPIGSPGVFQWTPNSVLDTNRTPAVVLLVPERLKEAQ